MLKFLIFLTSVLLSFVCNGQTCLVYDFNNTLSDTSYKYSTLNEVENKGTFIKDTVAQLNNYVKTVYRFGLNSGLTLNNTEVGNYIGKSYSIEMYFKLDMYNAWKRVIDYKNSESDTGPYIYMRKVSFYKYGSEDIPLLKPGRFLHFILTRNEDTKKVNIYINGNPSYEFIDDQELAVLDRSNKLILFHDNLSMGNEASAGCIALLKVYSKILTKDEVFENYSQILPLFKLLNNRPPAPKPRPEIIFKGNVMDKRSGAPVTASIRIEKSNDASMVKELSNTAGSGDFSTKLKSGSVYHFIVSAPGFMSYTEQLDLMTSNPAQPVNRDIELSRLEVGKTITLNKIIFKQSSPEMLPESYEDLNDLSLMMKQNVNMEIMLSGHTDNQGNAKLNLQLSEERVKTVKTYLVSKGVEASRITGKGFGGTKPLVKTGSEDARKANRRVEFTILKY